MLHKHASRIFLWGCALLCFFFLTSCSSSIASQELNDLFSAQTSVSCQIDYTLSLAQKSDDTEKDTLSQTYSGSSVLDLDSGFFHSEGNLSLFEGKKETKVLPLEQYYDPLTGETYTRFGTRYSATDKHTGLKSLATLPSCLDLEHDFSKQPDSIIVSGGLCDIYQGYVRSDDILFPVYMKGTHPSLSLKDTPVTVRLAIYQESSLPAQLNCQFDLSGGNDPSFTDDLNTAYTLESFSFTVTYSQYSQPVNIDIPEGFRAYALETATQEERPVPEVSDELYLLQTADASCSYQIATPTFTELESQTAETVSFYYFYSPDDFELLDYSLWDDFTPESAARYIKELPDYLQKEQSYTQMKASKLKTIYIHGEEVYYRTLHFRTAQSGKDYDTLLVYSYLPAPDKTHVLEVCLWQYNGTGDNCFFNVEDELLYAYGSVQSLN